MQSLKKFLVISFMCHAVLMLALIEVHFFGKKTDTAEVYEVSIVAGAPAAGTTDAGTISVPQGRKFIYTRKSERASLGEVKKERALKEGAPKLTPADIKPEAPVESPEAGSTSSLLKPQTPAGAGTAQAHGPSGGTPTEIALWKTRVRGLVESLWKTPPEIESMDAGLQTTYLLRVSRSGELLQKKLLVSSGNVPFDRSILIALGRANRFPQPPLILIAGQDWVEVTMSFTPPKGAH